MWSFFSPYCYWALHLQVRQYSQLNANAEPQAAENNLANSGILSGVVEPLMVEIPLKGGRTKHQSN
jgi:hypothetical protein